MFISMVVNDALQLSLVTALYVVSYIFRKVPVPVCCPLVRLRLPPLLWRTLCFEESVEDVSPASGCPPLFCQVMTAVFTTRSTPLILAGMAVERFVSICFPLHYSQTCTVPRTLLLISIILILTAAPPVTDLLITTLTEPPTFFQSAIFCDHSQLFRHSSVYYKNCVFDGLYLSFVVLTLLYTYCRIMLTARAASAGLASVNRARNTVLLHGVQVGVTGGTGSCRSPLGVRSQTLQSGQKILYL